MFKNTLIDEICQNGFAIIDNFLAEHHYQKLHTLAKELYDEGFFRPAKIGQKLEKKSDTTIRRDQIFWLDKQENNPSIFAYFTALEELAALLNESLFLGLIDSEAHLAAYSSGSFYKKHVDQFATTQDRRISCLYYLNTNWEPSFGGQLKLYDKNDNLLSEILPQGNRFVFFESHLPHEVNVTQRTRYSIAAWLKIRPVKL